MTTSPVRSPATAEPDEPHLLRFPVEAAWLGPGAVLTLTDRRLRLTCEATGATTTLPLPAIARHARRDRTFCLQLRRSGRWIDFAGRAFDGWFTFTCLSDAEGDELSRRLRAARHVTESFGPEVSAAEEPPARSTNAGLPRLPESG